MKYAAKKRAKASSVTVAANHEFSRKANDLPRLFGAEDIAGALGSSQRVRRSSCLLEHPLGKCQATHGPGSSGISR